MIHQGHVRHGGMGEYWCMALVGAGRHHWDPILVTCVVLDVGGELVWVLRQGRERGVCGSPGPRREWWDGQVLVQGPGGS